MTLAAGTRFGPYEILGALGSGGMGEVYRVRDTRLDRVVAMKVLPEHHTDPSRRERFQREARAVAALNHPHICTIHDVGHHAGVDYLVMELIEGESLATRLSRGPLSMDLALALAIEIADGLSRAHRQGIVHRDLKPGNVMLTTTGSGRPHVTHAKILDFGLASMVRPDRMEVTASALPTETAPLTEAGAVLGTLQYMAPEQVEGRPTDQRTDIFAFGTLLFEMVTGRRAFEGATSASLMAAILRQEAPTLPSSAPHALGRLVRTCLEKVPDDRFASMHDVMLQLRWIATSQPAESASPARSAAGPAFEWRRALITAAIVLAAASASFWWGRMTSTPEPSSGVAPTLTVLPFDQRRADFGGAVSPDGQTLVVVAPARQGAPTFLWSRRLAWATPERIGGTEGAQHPFWSADGREVGFFTKGHLKRMTIGAPGAVPLDVCVVAEGQGGAWFDDGTIVFTDGEGKGLQRVSVSAGDAKIFLPLEEAPGFLRFTFPVRVGSRHVLFLAEAAEPSGSELRLAGLDGPVKSKPVVRSAKNAVYANGFLFYDRQGVAVAQRMDEDTGVLTGEPVVVTGAVGGVGNVRYRSFMAGGRTVAWWTDQQVQTQLTWLDRTGTEVGSVGSAALYGEFALSPDDRRVAITVATDGQAGNYDLWTVDTGSGSPQRLTEHPGWDGLPRWDKDSMRLAFASTRGGRQDLYSLSIANPSDVTNTVEGPGFLVPVGWTPSGEFVWVNNRPGSSVKVSGPAWFKERGVIMTSPGGDPALVNGEPNVGAQVVLSPDGTALGYVRTLAGERQICLDSFPRARGCQLVWTSPEEVSALRLRADGRELIFKAGDDVMAVKVVKVQTGVTITVGKPARLFPSRGTRGLDVTRDGSRFLVGVPTTAALSTITVSPNWAPSGSK